VALHLQWLLLPLLLLPPLLLPLLLLPLLLLLLLLLALWRVFEDWPELPSKPQTTKAVKKAACKARGYTKTASNTAKANAKRAEKRMDWTAILMEYGVVIAHQICAALRVTQAHRSGSGRKERCKAWRARRAGEITTGHWTRVRPLKTHLQ
jgi:hypothetical protein